MEVLPKYQQKRTLKYDRISRCPAWVRSDWVDESARFMLTEPEMVPDADGTMQRVVGHKDQQAVCHCPAVILTLVS